MPNTTHEPESHGFFTFDFNQPIITNTVKNTMGETLDADADGFMFFEKCNDLDATINLGVANMPSNGIEESCDGVNGTTSGQYRYALYSMRGRKVMDAKFRMDTEIDLSPLAAGVYLLRVTDRDGAGVTRRVVRH